MKPVRLILIVLLIAGLLFALTLCVFQPSKPEPVEQTAKLFD
jgi:hypothetical protein